MANNRTWTDTYTIITKGRSCLDGAKKYPEWIKCMELPDNATDAERVACQRTMQKLYQDCRDTYQAYKGSGGKDVQEPPKPP